MLKRFTGSQPARLMQAIERDDADALAKLHKTTPALLAGHPIR